MLLHGRPAFAPTLDVHVIETQGIPVLSLVGNSNCCRPKLQTGTRSENFVSDPGQGNVGKPAAIAGVAAAGFAGPFYGAGIVASPL